MQIWIATALRKSAWAPLSVFCVYAVAARGFDAYLNYPWLDMPTHFAGGIAVTYFFLTVMICRVAVAGGRLKGIHFWLALGLTAMAAVIWEMLEYLSDHVLGTKMNLGWADTVSDLCFGLLGGGVAVALAALNARRKVSTAVKPTEKT